MSKVKKADYSHVDDALRGKVLKVIAESGTHTYSVSRVYEAYNAVFKKSETPQTCSSCLRNRVSELKKWLEEDEQVPVAGVHVLPQYIDEDAPGYVAQAVGTVRYPMLSGIPIDFLPAEGTITEGTGTYANGAPIEDGEHITAEGLTMVAIAGCITIYEQSPAKPVIPMVPAEPQYVDPGAPGFVFPALGSVRVLMGSGLPIDIQLEDGFAVTDSVIAKGVAKRADGSKVTPGTYIVANGDELAVQPGGKATLKRRPAVEEDLT